MRIGGLAVRGLLERRRFASSSIIRNGYKWFLLAILSGLISVNAFAANYEDIGIRISIPDGFEVSRTHVIQGGKSVSFRKNYPGESRGTVLQISTYDFGQAAAGIPEKARQDATDKILGQYLTGGVLAKQSFRAVARRHVLLDGIKASRADLDGELNGYPLSAILYCVIVGTRGVVFFVQDFRDAPQDNREAALKAIESVSFAKQ
jgi:hypothetical protein